MWSGKMMTITLLAGLIKKDMLYPEPDSYGRIRFV